MLISTRALKTALPAAGELRKTPACLRIAPDGTVTATDGHLLLFVKDRHPYPDEDFPAGELPAFHGSPDYPVVVKTDVIEAAIKATPKKGPIPVLHTIQVGLTPDDRASGTDPDVPPLRPYLAATDLTSHMQAPLRAPNDPDAIRYPSGADAVQMDHGKPLAERPHYAVILGVPLLESLLRSAKAAEAKAISFEVPTSKAYYTEPVTPSVVDPLLPPLPPPPCRGDLTHAIRASYTGPDVAVEAVIMPCRR